MSAFPKHCNVKPPLLFSVLFIIVLAGCKNKKYAKTPKAKKAATTLQTSPTPPSSLPPPSSSSTSKEKPSLKLPSPSSSPVSSSSSSFPSPSSPKGSSSTLSLSTADMAKMPAALRQHAEAIVAGTMDINDYIDYYEGYNSSILHILSYEQVNPVLVQKFLAAGADCNQVEEVVAGPDAASKPGQAALHIAAEQGNLAMVEMLLSGAHAQRARPDVTNTQGKTALHITAQGRHVAIAQKLLQEGADVNATDNRGLTPLWDAAYPCPNTAMIELLFQQKADPRIGQIVVDDRTYTLLEVLAMQHTEEVTKDVPGAPEESISSMTISSMHSSKLAKGDLQKHYLIPPSLGRGVILPTYFWPMAKQSE